MVGTQTTGAWDSKRNNFDFLRLALAVLVIYSHAFPLGTGSEVREPFVRLSHGQVTGGAVAVDSFFIMSGFLIAASAQRSRSVWSFLRKRFLRIYPAFLVSSALTLLVILPLSGGHLAEGSVAGRTGDVLLQAARLLEPHYTGAFPANPYPGILNGSIWSISYEFWCYLGVALLLVAGLLRKRAVIAGLFLLCWAVSIGFRVEGWILGGKMLGRVLGPPQFWARLLPLYLAGVVFFLYREHIPRRFSFALLSGAAMLGACWFYSGWTVLFPFAGAYLLFWFAFTPVPGIYRAGSLGDFSYGTYLYAFPIEQLLVQHAGTTLRPPMLFLCATPLTLLCAVGSWYAVERHFLEPGRRKETVVHALLEPATAK